MGHPLTMLLRTSGGAWRVSLQKSTQLASRFGTGSPARKSSGKRESMELGDVAGPLEGGSLSFGLKLGVAP